MAATTKRPMKRLSKRHLASALAALVAASIVLVLMRRDAPPDRAAAFPAGEIVVGVDASFPPFAHDDGVNLQGLDIDLASAIAAELDLPLRFVNIGFYALHDALISGQVDLLVSALRVDPARMDDIRYSQSYFDNGLLLASAGGDIDVDSLDNARIAYEYASSAESQIRAWEADGLSIQRQPYELPEYALDALRLNQADAAIIDATTLRLYLRARSEWRARYQHITHERYAIALRIDRADAWKLTDAALRTLKESGELAKIIDKWL